MRPDYILAGKNDSETLHALDQAVSQLDLLVSDLQNSVMKTRMQPIGRLFARGFDDFVKHGERPRLIAVGRAIVSSHSSSTGIVTHRS